MNRFVVYLLPALFWISSEDLFPGAEYFYTNYIYLI